VPSQTLIASRGPTRHTWRSRPEPVPIVLMHGFPDNTHLYDRLLPHLVGSRPVVRFDFLGWGRSDKPQGYPYTAANQIDDVTAVVDAVAEHLDATRLGDVLVEQLYEQFVPARPAFLRLNDDLLGTVLARRRHVPELRRFRPPVRIVFGVCDRYLNPRVARQFAALFPHNDPHLLDAAGHDVQVDQPQLVADLILAE
jgi:pimeloyl-ACP methyl ester carboxylesterase